MNIQDVIENHPSIVQGLKDGMLKSMFTKQKFLEEKYNPIEKATGALVPDLPLDIHTFHGQERARMLIYRITEELYEAGNCLRNKAWKRSQVPCDKDHFLEELADAVHFVIQLFLELGLEAEDVFKLYFRKSIVNEFRQQSKY
jgi:NTP pyrophosphatase (non-canonical NTP hydrolase)